MKFISLFLLIAVASIKDIVGRSLPVDFQVSLSYVELKLSLKIDGFNQAYNDLQATIEFLVISKDGTDLVDFNKAGYARLIESLRADSETVGIQAIVKVDGSKTKRTEFIQISSPDNMTAFCEMFASCPEELQPDPLDGPKISMINSTTARLTVMVGSRNRYGLVQCDVAGQMQSYFLEGYLFWVNDGYQDYLQFQIESDKPAKEQVACSMLVLNLRRSQAPITVQIQVREGINTTINLNVPANFGVRTTSMCSNAVWSWNCTDGTTKVNSERLASLVGHSLTTTTEQLRVSGELEDDAWLTIHFDYASSTANAVFV